MRLAQEVLSLATLKTASEQRSTENHTLCQKSVAYPIIALAKGTACWTSCKTITGMMGVNRVIWKEFLKKNGAESNAFCFSGTYAALQDGFLTERSGVGSPDPKPAQRVAEIFRFRF